MLSFVDSNLRLQLQARFSFCSCTPEASKRARMRWALLRDAIRADWWRYANFLKGGSMRWRAWFGVWRAAARYIAIREILIFHVGYEVLDPTVQPTKFSDKLDGKAEMDSQTVLSYSLSECLLMDQRDRDLDLDSYPIPEESNGDRQETPSTQQNKNKKSKDEIDAMLTKLHQKRYIGSGQLSPSSVSAAEKLLKIRIASPRSKNYLDIQRESDEAMSLPQATVRALYSLQLEMDTVLTVIVSARCRLWSEERHKNRRAYLSDREGDDSYENSAGESGSVSSSSSSTTPIPVPTAVLYLAVLDATDLKVSKCVCTSAFNCHKVYRCTYVHAWIHLS